MRSLTERELCVALAKFIQEGKTLRRKGGRNPYAGNTIAHMLSVVGWTSEDLRIGLMKANPTYAAHQKAFGKGLDQ